MGARTLQSPLVELEGDPREMGEEYGRKCRSEIRAAVATNSRITQFYTGLTQRQCARSVGRFIPYLEDAVPNLCDEMRGIADGAGLSYDDVVGYQFHGRDLAGIGGCTMVHLKGDSGVSSITGQTVDWTPSLEPYYHVVVRRPRKGLDTVQFTMAGLLGLIGKNEKGTSVFMNVLLTSEKIGIGVPAYLMLRLLMEQPSLRDALTTLKRTKRTSPFNFMIAGPDGAFNVESSAAHLQVTDIGSRNYVHTNHCLRKPMSSGDVYTKMVKSDETLRRYARMRGLVKKQASPILDTESLFSLLKDHENYPESICRHSSEALPSEGRMKTLGAVLMREGENGIWVAKGNPCQSHLEFFSL